VTMLASEAVSSMLELPEMSSVVVAATEAAIAVALALAVVQVERRQLLTASSWREVGGAALSCTCGLEVQPARRRLEHPDVMPEVTPEAGNELGAMPGELLGVGVPVAADGTPPQAAWREARSLLALEGPADSGSTSCSLGPDQAALRAALRAAFLSSGAGWGWGLASHGPVRAEEHMVE